MKNTPENFVVIHVSASAVRTVVARHGADMNHAEVMAVGVADTESFGYGKIIHRERLIAAIKKSITAAEEMANVRIVTAVVCLTSPELFSNNGVGEVFVWDEQISNTHMAKALTVTKNKVIPKDYYLAQFIPQKIWLDNANHTVKGVVGMTGITKLAVSYHLMSLPVASLNNIYGVFKDCDVMVDNIIFDAVAGAEYALIPEEREQGVLFIDIGKKSTSICAYKENILLYSDCIAMGGDDVTMDIAAELSVSTIEAERLKRQSTSLQLKEEDKQMFVDMQAGGESGVVHRYRLSQIAKARYDLLFAEIFSALSQTGLSKEFFEAGIVLSGEATQIKGMVPYLKGLAKLPVHMTNQNPAIGIYAKRLSDDHLKSLSVLLKERRLQTALGATLYHLNDEFSYQQRIHDEEDGDAGVLSTFNGMLGGIVKFFRKIA